MSDHVRDPGPAPTVAFVALGSNLGDRAGYLARGRAAIDALSGTRLIAASDIEETAPIGPAGQGAYLNQMVAIETTRSPAALLEGLLAIEREEGRLRTARWGARTLDLDIVRFGDLALAEAGLVIPHPELPNRSFWQRELAQLQGALVP